MSTGYILLHRSIMEWEWYSDVNTFRAFLHCLLSANWEDKKWRGIPIKRGQFFTSIENFSAGCGLTVRQTRTAFERLKSTNEIDIITTNNGSMITICKYDDYQDIKKSIDKRTTDELTIECQTSDKQATTTNTLNTLKEDKKEVKGIIDFLNEQAKSKFSPSAKGNIKYIEARLKEGRTTDEFKIVIKDRCKRWMGNAAMSEYLRPETLFGNKFDGYYNEALRAGAKIENTEEKDGIENNALILALEPHVRSQMSWRDKIDYINSKQP